jgi:hypothetical protein
MLIAFEPGGAVVRVVADDNSVVAGAPGEDTAVTNVVLHVADDGSLRDPPQWQHVADGERGAAAAIDKLAGVHALGGDEELLLVLVPEGMAEGDLGERRAAAGVVDDVGDDALEVPVALAEVEGAEPGGALAVVGVRLEHGPRTLTLRADHATHHGGGRGDADGGGGWRREKGQSYIARDGAALRRYYPSADGWDGRSGMVWTVGFVRGHWGCRVCVMSSN